MSAVAAHAVYASASAVTASPQEIVRLAYERVLTSCDRAELANRLRPGNWVQLFHDEMVRGQQILLELTGALSMTHADPAVTELSRHLRDLYMYAIDQMIAANVTKDVAKLGPVRMVVGGLHDAWTRRAQ